MGKRKPTEHEEYLNELRREWYVDTFIKPYQEWKDSEKGLDLTPIFCVKCGKKLHICE